ncbi:DUF6055 domain-containing protein [Leptospira sarikeiensis]|uniref:Peptidase MA family protein n=1 Tax=Leptospira sarikeiensis TaxID=2484943 RepID=A0A4R9K5T8_9LEPT|nr:DUF6055 domain-containing protein [Leptospira sarikeiensis]TGL60571.1 hypothetical protein EHQ64_12120 [Leptospira sarikeiensis]
MFSKTFRFSFFFLLFVSAFFAQEQVRKLNLNNGSDLPKFKLPSLNTAPTTWEELQNIPFPAEQDFALKIPNAAGHYLGPDGGAVYQWSPGFYRWDLKDGYIFIRRSSDEWGLDKENTKIYSFPKKCPGCQSEKVYTFPDGSQIAAAFHEVSGKLEYLYNHPNEKTYFRFYKPGRYGKISEQKDRFDFQFDPRDSLFIHAFTESKTTTDFFKKAEKDFELIPSSKILVAFFHDTKAFRDFNNLAGATCTGGRGGIYGISFCDLTPEKDIFKEDQDPEIRKHQYSNQPVYMVYHEITHHMQQIRCENLRIGKEKLPPISQPSWLVEGHAEFIAQYGWPKFKGTKYREYYENFIVQKNRISLEKSNPYLVGFLALDFISQKYGNSKIKEIWDKTCEGESIDSALKSSISSNSGKLQSDLSNYLESEGKDLPSKFLQWEIEGTLTIPYTSSEASSFKPDTLTDLVNLTETSSIPDIHQIFALRMDFLKGKTEGVYQSPRKERVFLFKNGTYRIETPKYQVNVFPDGTTGFTSEKVSITVWGNGTRKWDSGGKTLTYFPPK